MNWEIPDAQTGFRKDQKNQEIKLLTRSQRKKRNFRKTSTSVSLTMLKPLTVWIIKNWKTLKEMGIPGHLTFLLRNLYAGQEATVRTLYRTTDCPIQWTWTWANSRRWWGTGKPGMLQSRQLRKVWYDLASEQQQQQYVKTELMPVTVTVEERAFLSFFFFLTYFIFQKDPVAGKDWRQNEKRVTEDEKVK